jgi:hypothetical protein
LGVLGPTLTVHILYWCLLSRQLEDCENLPYHYWQSFQNTSTEDRFSFKLWQDARRPDPVVMGPEPEHTERRAVPVVQRNHDETSEVAQLGQAPEATRGEAEIAEAELEEGIPRSEQSPETAESSVTAHGDSTLGSTAEAAGLPVPVEPVVDTYDAILDPEVRLTVGLIKIDLTDPFRANKLAMRTRHSVMMLVQCWFLDAYLWLQLADG